MSDLTKWVCTTESGAIYYLTRDGEAWYASQDIPFYSWGIVDRDDSTTLPEVLSRGITDTPEVGKAIYCEGFGVWRLSTKITDIEEIGG